MIDHQSIGTGFESGWFRHLVEAAPNAMVVVDNSGVIRMVNGDAESVFGYDRSELIGFSVDMLLPEQFKNTHSAQRSLYFSNPSRRAMGAGRDLYARRKDGSEFPVEIGLNPINTDDGTMVLSVIVDITERKRAESVAHNSMALQAAIVNSSEDAIISTSINGVITSWNPGAESLLGYSAREAVGHSLSDLLGASGLDRPDQSNISALLLDGLAKHYERQHHHKNGSLVDLAVTLTPLLDSNGALTGFVFVKRDMSGRRKTEERFRVLIESMPTGILIVNDRGRIDLVNTYAERIFGYSRHELLGKTVDVLLPNDLREHHPSQRASYFAAPSARSMGEGRDLMGMRKDGSHFPVEIGLSPIDTDQGMTVLAVVSDISERLKASQTIAAHRDELARSNQELSTFAYVASHDLKSPLRGIDQLSIWIAEDLHDKNFDAIPKHTQMLQSRIRRMENLLDDLLAYSRVGRVEGGVSSVSVADLAMGVFDMVAPTSGLTLQLGPELPVFTTLVTPFEQILRNLFSNSQKHHDQKLGHISLECRQIDRHFYQFSVSDDGPGIPPQYQERVFKMFQTLRPRDEVEGSGMGLALVKKLVETYGGEIEIDSDGIRGCSIRFTWPISIKRKDDY